MTALTEYQRELVEQHMNLVDYVLWKRIGISDCAYLSYEDYYQIGCEALCRAAAAYRPEVGEFKPLAIKSVYNAAIDHLRRQKLEASLRVFAQPQDDDDDRAEDLTAASEMNTEQEVIDGSMVELISGYCDKYTGVTRLGVEAILLKTLGYSNSDIAESYGTTTNNVRAWISRARIQLRADKILVASVQ